MMSRMRGGRRALIVDSANPRGGQEKENIGDKREHFILLRYSSSQDDTASSSAPRVSDGGRRLRSATRALLNVVCPTLVPRASKSPRSS